MKVALGDLGELGEIIGSVGLFEGIGSNRSNFTLVKLPALFGESANDAIHLKPNADGSQLARISALVIQNRRFIQAIALLIEQTLECKDDVFPIFGGHLIFTCQMLLDRVDLLLGIFADIQAECIS